MDLHDGPAGHLEGIVIDRRENRPMYLVVTRGRGAAQQRPNSFLVPVGDAWFDETARAVRVDVPARQRIPFDPDEFERMTPQQADEYERRVLATCCPEIGFTAMAALITSHCGSSRAWYGCAHRSIEAERRDHRL